MHILYQHAMTPYHFNQTATFQIAKSEFEKSTKRNQDVSTKISFLRCSWRLFHPLSTIYFNCLQLWVVPAFLLRFVSWDKSVPINNALQRKANLVFEFTQLRLNDPGCVRVLKQRWQDEVWIKGCGEKEEGGSRFKKKKGKERREEDEETVCYVVSYVVSVLFFIFGP